MRFVELRALILAEKPSLMRDIKSSFGTSSRTYDADFMSFRGHFMELSQPDDYESKWGKPWNLDVLPMIPDKFTFNVKSDCSKEYKAIKDALNSGIYDFVVNACDAGREGEAIFWTFYMKTGCKLPVKRLWASDTTTETLSAALDGLLDYSSDKYLNALRDSSLCRMYSDWLIGMNLSRAATLKTNKLIPVGRVQTPTLNIVVQRDLAIDNFKPENYFEIEADFDKYKGLWFNPDTNETSFQTEEDAKKLIARLGNKGKIDSVEENKVTEYAPALFSLAELQKEANRVFGFTANETLEIAQALYEKHKILSYPRTESRALSTNLSKEIVKHLEAIKDVPEVEKYVKAILADSARITRTMANKKYVDNKKVTDHHAIIFTKQKPNLTALTDKEKKLYLLVIKKTISIFMDPCITNKTVIITDVSGEKFKTTGSIVLQMGYKEIYKEPSEDVEIPPVKEGEEYPVKEFKLNAKQTQPPKPYTDSSLLAAMQQAGKFLEDESLKDILVEAKGLGTAATRAGIIERLIEKNLLTRKGKTIRSTDFGKSVISVLSGKDVILPDMTAQWEEKLRKMEESDLSMDAFMKEMRSYTEKETNDFVTTINTNFGGNATKEAIGKCPKCGKDVVLGNKYAICRNYKGEVDPCDFVIARNIGGKDIPDTEIKKLLNGNSTKVMKFKSKTTGKTFEASLVIDEETKTVKYSFAQEKEVAKCPKCGGNIIDKGKVCKCDNEECGFFLSKTICNSNLTDKDVKDLLTGKTTATKKFFKNGKPWYAKLKYSEDFTKLDFIFETKK